MAITDTDTLTGALGYAISDAIIEFNKSNVFWNLIEKKNVNKGAIYARFPVYTKMLSSAVTANAAGAEGADTSNSAIASAPVDIEVLRYSIRTDVTDLAIDGNADNAFENSGMIIGNAIAAKFDDVIYNDMSASAVSSVSSSGALTMDYWFEAIQTLKNEGIQGPYSAVLNSRQIWGDKGLSSEIIQASSTAIGTLGNGGADLANNGFLTNLAGVNVYWTPEISATQPGIMFGKNAQGVAYKDMAGNGSFIIGELDRNAAGALTEIVSNGYFSTDQLNASASVLILSDLT